VEGFRSEAFRKTTNATIELVTTATGANTMLMIAVIRLPVYLSEILWKSASGRKKHSLPFVTVKLVNRVEFIVEDRLSHID